MWYMPAPASSASRRAMSAIVVLRKTLRSASTPSSQMPPASLPSSPTRPSSDWTPIDATALKVDVTTGAASLWILSANIDLWTANAGVNQDVGIFVSGGAYGTGTLVAWKESGGFAGTFSPNAAYVQTVIPLAAASTYTITLKWKANKSTTGTIYAAAGSTGNFSPTRVTAQQTF